MLRRSAAGHACPSIDPVDALLVCEQERAIKTFGRCGEVVRAEALVVLSGRDRHCGAQDAGRGGVQEEVAQLGVIEVVLGVGLGRGRWVVGERDRRCLVVHPNVEAAAAWPQ